MPGLLHIWGIMSYMRYPNVLQVTSVRVNMKQKQPISGLRVSFLTGRNVCQAIRSPYVSRR